MPTWGWHMIDLAGLSCSGIVSREAFHTHSFRRGLLSGAVLLCSTLAKPADADASPVFTMIEACFSFQQTADVAELDALFPVRRFGKLCDACTASFGEFRVAQYPAVLKVSFVGQGYEMRVSCETSGDFPPDSGQTEVGARAWVETFWNAHGLTSVPDEPWSVFACADGIVPYRLTVLYDVDRPEAEALVMFHGRPRMDHCLGDKDDA